MDNDTVVNANIEFYKDRVDDYEQVHQGIFNKKRQAYIEGKIQEIYEKSDGKTFLDIGCGKGNLTKFAAERFKNIIGVDVSDEMLKEIKKQFPKGKFHNARADSMPMIKTGTVSAIGMYSVWHHIFDHESTIKEILRVLKKGGVFYSDHDPNIQYYDGFSKSVHYRVIQSLVRTKLRLFNNYKESTRHEHTEVEKIAEYYHHHGGNGLAASELQQKLLDAGFSAVKVTYSFKIDSVVTKYYRALHKITRSTDYFPIFSIIAVK